MTLRLVQEEVASFVNCPTCDAKGTVPCPPTIATRSGVWGSNANGPINQPSDGFPIPCPTCLGKKVVKCNRSS